MDATDDSNVIPVYLFTACNILPAIGGKGSKTAIVKEVLDPELEAEMAEAEKAYQVL